MSLDEFYFSMTIFIGILSVLSLFLSVITFILVRKNAKKSEDMENTYGYLKFLDDANQRLYEKYMKERMDNKSKPRSKKR